MESIVFIHPEERNIRLSTESARTSVYATE